MKTVVVADYVLPVIVLKGHFSAAQYFSVRHYSAVWQSVQAACYNSNKRSHCSCFVSIVLVSIHKILGNMEILLVLQ